MNDLPTRVRDYLDKKKPRKVETVTDSVMVGTDEDEDFKLAMSELKEAWRIPIEAFKGMLIIFSVLVIMWSLAVVDIQNDCWLNKECREWVKIR